MGRCGEDSKIETNIYDLDRDIHILIRLRQTYMNWTEIDIFI